MKNLKEYGGYALVTGASAGIGTEFARQIAAQGVSCVLVARRQDRLEALRDELTRAHKVDVRCVAFDLSREDCAERLLEATKDIPVGILVNNAGFGDGGAFETKRPERMAEMIKLNCIAPALLSRAYVPAMLERKRGAIVMVSSGLGIVACPYEAVYGATKAFDLSLGEALSSELEGTGVDVVTICPAATATEFLAVEGFTEEECKKAYRNADTAEYIARITLEGLGRKTVVLAKDSAMINAVRRVVPRSRAVSILKSNMKRRLVRN